MVFKYTTKMKRLVRIAKAEEVSRRLFVTNSLDGLLSILGIVLGILAMNIKDPTAYVGAGLGGIVTMGFFSGFMGTYMSEKAERLKELKHIERSVLADLDNSVYGEVARVIPLYVAFWSLLGVVFFPAISLLPYVACMLGVLNIMNATLMSIIIIHALLFTLGAYLGKISEEPLIKSGLKMVLIGCIATILFLMLRTYILYIS